MNTPDATATAHTDSILFYGEHGAAFLIGLCCACKYLLEDNAGQKSPWLLSISVPLIGISLVRTAFFWARRKKTPKGSKQFDCETGAGIGRGIPMHQDHFSKRGIR